MTKKEIRALGSNRFLEELLAYTRCKSPEMILTAAQIHFDGPVEMTMASLRELKSIRGMDEDTARFFRLLGEISGRVIAGKEARSAVTGPAPAAAILSSRLRGLENEALCCLCLDKLWRPISCTIIIEGDADQTPSENNTVYRTARSAGSRAVILAHNHPPGFPYPSVEDVGLTESMAKALKKGGVTLVDHIVISREKYVSMAESGFLPPDDALREIYLSGKAGEQV